MTFYEETIRSKTIYKGNVTEYVVDDVKLPNGKMAKREIVRHDGAAAVLPFTNDDKLVLVKQYRKAIDQLSIEIPAGLKDESDENSMETAKRELEEETGYNAKSWKFVTSFYSTPGFTDEFLEIYEATDLFQIEDPLSPDEDENIEVIKATYDEAWDYYNKGLLRDSKTVFALFYWKMRKLEIKLGE
ncbi:MAG: NUDIX hydrolase [Alkalibacterium sp.]|uniref:NUDIX hydrolase n=1 Tax=Alkalibacterium sp. TaxID=1872447 RepID=UPI0026478C60|nr:NUDIX hydrolase [Alkalibacterium sp.]MDN6293237.1 NUDIX hydrolase [Alkalibacterium sp.]MDN6295924.1 NUDIX hydrolase [Alkalibacterium sp.]